MAKARELDAELATLREQKSAWTERKALKERLSTLSERDLREALLASAMRLRGTENMLQGFWDDPSKLEQLKPAALRHVLTTLVDRIELNPKTDPLKFTIHYRLPITGARVASPRQSAAKPAIKIVRRLCLTGFRRRRLPEQPKHIG